MDVPTLVEEALGEEDVAAHVPLKGEDALFITPSRTIHYREEGLLSDESVAEYPHDAERVEVEEGRRKATIRLDYGTRGTEAFNVPSSRLDEALHPVLAGVLNAMGVTEPGETVKRTFRFSELTLVVTSRRLVKHIGSAVWDPEYEEVVYEDVTDVDVEEGNVSSQFVLTTPNRTQRVKAPNESFREVEESVRDAILAAYDVGSLDEFRELKAAAETEEATMAEEEPDGVSFDSGVEPIRTGEDDSGEESKAQAMEELEDASEDLAESGFTSAAATVEGAVDPEALVAEIEKLESAIAEQEAALEAQRRQLEAIKELIPDR
jgi:hypothetical protein